MTRYRMGLWLAALGVWSIPLLAAAQSDLLQGELRSPTICPIDSQLLSLEVHDGSTVRLVIYNRATGDFKEVASPEPDNFGMARPAASQNRDLAWRPVADGSGDIWAAFVGNGAGSLDLYLYNFTKDQYWRLPHPADSSGIGRETDPAWSPDGGALAYTTNLAGNADIYVIPVMKAVLDNPDEKAAKTSHMAVASSDAHEFGPQWSPVLNSGYMAYNHYDPAQRGGEVRVYDLYRNRSYGLMGRKQDVNYIAPSWSPSGTRLGYYEFETEKAALSDVLEPQGEQFYLGISKITTPDLYDSLSIQPVRGGRSFVQTGIVEVAENRDTRRGPAWLPNDEDVLVPVRDEAEKNPLKQIVVYEWELSGRKSDWQVDPPVGSATYDFASDITVLGGQVAFTYQQGQDRAFQFGSLEPRDTFNVTPEPLFISNARRTWWKDSYYEPPGSSALAFLTRPWIGSKNIGINTPLFLIAAAGAGVIYAVTRPEDEPPPAQDWRPPGYPNSLNVGTGNLIQVRF